MPIFAVHYTYSDATIADRDTHRPRHRAWLADRLAAGSLLSSGPYPDGSGALLLFRATDAGTLAELLAQDPFAQEKLIDAVRAVEWQPVFGVFAD
ncbi:YciI family protein [Nocardia sp. NPDC051750]|uniref:YciI family protein n=1 Tax=Nocardia sp. NPDC051750 TaxID=3364325 RepID=UPI00379B8A6A